MAQPDGVADVVQVHRDEAVVLEPAQDPEQRHDAHRHRDAPIALVAHRRHRSSAGEGHQGRREQEEAVAPPHPAVEHVAQEDHCELPPARIGVEQPVHRERDGEEEGEVDRGKEHRRRSGGCAECTAGQAARTRTPRGREPDAAPAQPAHWFTLCQSGSRRPNPGGGMQPPASAAGFSDRGGTRRAGSRAVQLLALSASISAGRTLCTSPTMPRSATEKIGASASLLIAMMFFEPFMPTRC